MERIDKRKYDELRNIKISRNYLKHPQGSVLMEMGETKIICTATVEDKVPPFLKGTDTGWITAEYSMLPGSTIKRKIRDSSKGRIEGRTQEIQRLIGRALRTVVDLKVIGERTIWIDCDVIQADGGTRTASISGAFVALVDALNKLYIEEEIPYIPISGFVSAVSVGIIKDIPVLDLCYQEDYKAEVDMNIVMTDKYEFVEIQGTGEESTFSIDELHSLINLAKKGNEEIILKQKEALGKIGELIGKTEK
ncbi:ribonuclease PH [Anaerosalibacter massiliensis]|uniref:Ribonuclease PH n=1 Tax=Anaerosalibacter massiliensis TaxID=1347392 RepID=A0A9X2MJ67_9FIRM|nr:ribonuclease PH [Anaerosalibacter massiliensis]MCR2044629.1 ribonuclease PH [Anaerosalibacter massiliensis]